MRITAELDGVKKEKTLEMDNNPAEQDWVDVVIDKNTRKVEVELRTNIKDGGENGVEELPPLDAQATPLYKSRPNNDLLTQKNLTKGEYHIQRKVKST